MSHLNFLRQYFHCLGLGLGLDDQCLVLVLCLETKTPEDLRDVSVTTHCQRFFHLTAFIPFGHIHHLVLVTERKRMKHIRDVILASVKINSTLSVIKVIGHLVMVIISVLVLALLVLVPSLC